MEDELYLRVIKEGDLYRVVDQDGRKVAGVQTIDVSASCFDATTVTITFLEHNAEGGKQINRKGKSDG